MPDAREPYGRIFHEKGRLTVNAEREKPFGVQPWEGRTEEEKELDMRGASAVAEYALTENAVSWGTTCTSCARVLGSAYEETGRREQAEIRLAEIRLIITTFLAIRGEHAEAADLAEGIRQVLDRDRKADA